MYYITLSLPKKEIINNIKINFRKEYHDFLEVLQVVDLSSVFYSNTILPKSWKGAADANITKVDILEYLMKFFSEYAKDSVIFLDSIGDLARKLNNRWEDLVFFIKGLNRMSKTWDGLIYALLTADVLDGNSQEEIIDSADGVLKFEWREVTTGSKRRMMHFEKFQSIMQELGDTTSFESQVASFEGFEISNIQQIMGR